VRTLVISDLHLGSAKDVDLVRRRSCASRCWEAVRSVDRLVILGDGVELRDRPKRAIGELVAGVFGDFGRALGADGELVLVGGNHDHGLVVGWIDARLETEPSGFLASSS
jgi:metallophosphoesterase superfamily enzyme